MRQRFRLELGGLRDAGLLRPMLPVAAFELGNMATTLLILRATTLLHSHGRSLPAATSLVVLIYAGHNLFAALVAYAGGHWIDRAGPRIAFAAGAFVYVASYVLFATASAGWPYSLSRSCWRVRGSVSLRLPSQRWLLGCSPTDCAGAASVCSAGCSRSETSRPQPLLVCSGAQSPLSLVSPTPRRGCASLVPPRSGRERSPMRELLVPPDRQGSAIGTSMR